MIRQAGITDIIAVLIEATTCIVPKNLTINTLKQPMGYGRLTERKIRYIVRHKQRGKSDKEIAFEMRVSP